MSPETTTTPASLSSTLISTPSTSKSSDGTATSADSNNTSVSVALSTSQLQTVGIFCISLFHTL